VVLLGDTQSHFDNLFFLVVVFVVVVLVVVDLCCCFLVGTLPTSPNSYKVVPSGQSEENILIKVPLNRFRWTPKSLLKRNRFRNMTFCVLILSNRRGYILK